MISDNYTLVEMFDCKNLYLGFERRDWTEWGTVNLLSKSEVADTYQEQ